MLYLRFGTYVPLHWCAQLPRRGVVQADDDNGNEGGYRDWQEDDSPPASPDSTAAVHGSAQQVRGSVAHWNAVADPYFGKRLGCQVQDPVDNSACGMALTHVVWAQFTGFLADVDAAIARLGGTVFPKLNWSAPKVCCSLDGRPPMPAMCWAGLRCS